MSTSNKKNKTKQQKEKVNHPDSKKSNQGDTTQESSSKTIQKILQNNNPKTKIKTEVQTKVEAQKISKPNQKNEPNILNKTSPKNQEIVRKTSTVQEQQVISDVLKQAQNKKAQCQSKLLQKSNMLQGYYIIPNSAVQGQYQHSQEQMKRKQPQKNVKDPKIQNKNQENKETDDDIYFSADFEDLEETTEVETEKKQQKIEQEEDPNERHYILPGTMFEGQYQYLTKEKKEQDVQKQLQQLQDQKRQLQISTEHYIIPSTVVESQVQRGGKEHKNEEVEKQLQKLKAEEEEQRIERENEKPKVMHRVNLHEFNSTEVPELHQQDVPINLQPEVIIPKNLHQAIENPKMKSIKPLQPVSLNQSNIESSNVPSLKPVSLNQPLLEKSENQSEDTKKEKPEDQQRHYIIPGTCYEGQFTYVTKQKKQEDVQKQIQSLDDEKRQLEISTEHYVVPTTNVQSQVRKDQKKQKPQIRQKEIKEVQKENRKQNMLKQKLHKNKYAERSSVNRSEFSQGDTQGLKLLKEKSNDKRFIKMEIKSDQEGMLPYKIDEFTAMTVTSNTNQEERPSLTIPQCEQPNDDLEIIVIQTSLNKQATSPRDLVNEKPNDVLGNQKMQSLLDNIRYKDGAPIKVVISTKQFANYPGQSSPSPPIIDENTLSEFRKKNHSEFLQRNTHKNQMTTVGFQTKNNEEGNPEQIDINSMNIKEKTTQIIDGRQKIELQRLQVTLDVNRIKRLNEDEDKRPPFLPKLVKSAVFSTLVGGLAWISLEDKRIAAISAATGLALALIVQK